MNEYTTISRSNWVIQKGNSWPHVHIMTCCIQQTLLLSSCPHLQPLESDLTLTKITTHQHALHTHLAETSFGRHYSHYPCLSTLAINRTCEVNGIQLCLMVLILLHFRLGRHRDRKWVMVCIEGYLMHFWIIYEVVLRHLSFLRVDLLLIWSFLV